MKGIQGPGPAGLRPLSCLGGPSVHLPRGQELNPRALVGGTPSTTPSLLPPGCLIWRHQLLGFQHQETFPGGVTFTAGFQPLILPLPPPRSYPAPGHPGPPGPPLPQIWGGMVSVEASFQSGPQGYLDLLVFTPLCGLLHGQIRAGLHDDRT